ncbi:MAG: hypothetical protein EOP48_12960, partial [Sphingobacteriales bacterium]
GEGNLKALITQSEIKLRRAYAVFNENLRRRASFMGSVNDAEFLTDTTGNRRYLIFTCEDIDYKHGLNMDLVYSQAYALYKGGKFKYIFDKEDLPKLEELAFDYLRISTEEDMLIKYYLPAIRDAPDSVLLTPTEILQEIEKKEGHIFDKYSSQRRLGQAMQKHGFKKVSQSNRKPYIVARKEVATVVVKDDRVDVSHISTTGYLPDSAFAVPKNYSADEEYDIEEQEIEYAYILEDWRNRQRLTGKGLIESFYFGYQRMLFQTQNPSIEITANDDNWIIDNMCQIIELDMEMEAKEEIIRNVFAEFKHSKTDGLYERTDNVVTK